MAIGTGTALAMSAALQAGGGLLNARSQTSAAKKANQRQDALLAEAAGMRQAGPSAAETALMNLFAGIGNGQGYAPQQIDLGSLGGQGFNTGQDALMQMLRSNGVDKALESIMQTGDPFDNSELFRSLGVLDREAQGTALDDLRSGNAGLGQRFGGAQRRAEVDLLSSLTNNAAVRNAGIQSSAYEAAQGRRLAATGQGTQRDQMRTGIAQLLQQGGLSMSDLLMRATGANNAANLGGAQFGLQQQGLGAQILQMIMGSEANRRNFNLSTLGLGGAPNVPGYGYGNAIGDFGQILAFLAMLPQLTGGSGNRQSTNTGGMSNYSPPGATY